MKRIFSLFLTLILLTASLPALAAGADVRANLPDDIRAFFSTSAFNGYIIDELATEIFENTAGGSFAFVAACKGNQHILYGFELKDGKWVYWLKNAGILLPSDKAYILANCKGQIDIETDQVYQNDSLQIILLSDTEDYYVHSQVFTVNEYGQWHLKSIFSHLLAEKTVTNAWVEKDRILYYQEELAKSTTVWGVTETNLRYFSIAAFPPTVKDARNTLTTPPKISADSDLSPILINFTGGQKFPVYTGPGPQYARAGGGKASVSTNDWIQVFGEENGYILIQYDITADQMRFGYITADALPQNASVPPLDLAHEEARLTRATYLTDDPLNSQSLLLMLPAERQGVEWLGQMGEWVYVEVESDSKTFRGFVPASSITYTTGLNSYSAALDTDSYSATASIQVQSGTQLTAQIIITYPLNYFYDANREPDGYQLYANNVPILAQTTTQQTALPDGRRQSIFSITAVLPANASLLGLCPIYDSIQKADETIMIYLTK